MSHARRGAPETLTFPEVFQLPITTNVHTAAKALGICTSTAYRLIRKGTFPCPVMRVGWQYRIPTTSLMRALGIEEQPVYLDESEEGPTPIEPPF
ncbi:helix-turn-helix domain-containing protein [Streptomyces sp. NPDC090025]|uniref:helix-turn-helix domain-containing protein n=1 Tax=Streptomyces sp. NPDC090025 TaxID=3365922 RepID=UPI003837E3D6